MKARFVQRGSAIDYTPNVDIQAGDIVKVGELIGVAKLDIKAGELGALALTGVYEIASNGAVLEAGSIVSVNPVTGKICAADAEGALKFGYAFQACSANDPVVTVRLTQGL